MNKKLVSIMVGTALACGTAVSQADVNIYGKVHVSLDSLDSGGSDSGANAASGLFLSSNSSRIGFKGSEDLGDGLKAMWQVEGTVGIADGGGQFATRNSFVGVSGGFGSVLLGRHDTPFKTVGRKVDFFGDQIGDSRNLISGANPGFDLRPNDVLAYHSPNWSGFKLDVALVVEDGTVDASAFSVSGMYKTDAFMVGAAMENHGEGLTAGADSDSGMRIVGSFKAGPAKINALYQTLSDVGGVAGNDITNIGIGAGFKMGNGTIKGQYYMLDSDAADSNASMIALGHDHKLSKMTSVYAAYAQTDNDANVYYSAFGGGHSASPAGATSANGDDPSGLSFGVVHKF